jgi:hypothetical protein
MRKNSDNTRIANSFEIQTKSKVIDMNKIFTDLFLNKGYNQKNQFFKKDVWFLKSDENFQNNFTLLTTITPGENKIIYEIIKSLSDNYLIKRLEIDYIKFIQAICEKLYITQETINRCQNQINLYSAHENVGVIEAKLKLLEEMKKNSNTENSFIEISLNKSQRVNEPSLEYILNYSELDKSDSNTSQNKKINLKSKSEIKLAAMDTITKEINSQSNSNIRESLTSTTKSLSYSGTTFSKFNLLAFKNGVLYAESSTEYFLLMLLVHIKELKEIEKPYLSLSWKVNLKKIESKESDEREKEEMSVTIDFRILLENKVRAAIFRRVHKLLKDAITTLVLNESIKNEILEYFPEISKSVSSVLERKDDEVQKDCLCASCSIF